MSGRPRRSCRMSPSSPTAARPSPIHLLALPDDLLLDVLARLDPQEKKNARETCSRLLHLTNHLVTHLTLDDLQIQELTGPTRRNALCLRLASRLPALASATFTSAYSGPVSPIPRILTQLTQLTRLDCYTCRPAAPVLQLLGRCPLLQELHVDATALTKTLAPLPPLPALQTLRINLHTACLGPAQLTTLTAHYPRVRSLSIDTLGCSFPLPAFVADLTPLSALRLAALNLTWFNGHLSAPIAHLAPTLTALTLTGPALTTPTANSLLHLTALRTLSWSPQFPAHATVCWHPDPPPSAAAAAAAKAAAAPPHPLPTRAPTFPHLTTLHVPARLLAAPLCPRAPALRHLTTAFSRWDSDLASLDALLAALPLATTTRLAVSIEGNSRTTTLKLLDLLVAACPSLAHLDLNGPFPTAAVRKVAALKALRSFSLDTRALTTCEQDALESELRGLQEQLPQLRLTFCVNLPPAYVWFWNMLHLM